jgi:hypothetical protein
VWGKHSQRPELRRDARNFQRRVPKMPCLPTCLAEAEPVHSVFRIGSDRKGRVFVQPR